MKEIHVSLDRLLCVLTSICVLFLACYIFVICHRLEKVENLENRIEILEMEATTNKLLLKQTQRLVVPNERALKEKIR